MIKALKKLTMKDMKSMKRRYKKTCFRRPGGPSLEQVGRV
jgi:hypothetical protein